MEILIMPRVPRLTPISWPRLNDAEAAAVYGFVNELLVQLESHYFAQIHRHHQANLDQGSCQLDLFASNGDQQHRAR
jgi:hypothetical protein